MQDLVETSQKSSRHPAFLINGAIGEETHDFPIVSPVPEAPSRITAHAAPSEHHRNGRRVLLLERAFFKPWTPELQDQANQPPGGEVANPCSTAGGEEKRKKTRPAPSPPRPVTSKVRTQATQSLGGGVKRPYATEYDGTEKEKEGSVPFRPPGKRSKADHGPDSEGTRSFCCVS